ncbi:MAG: methylated-DNA--[protein]-cysteine S-methyltransferase [Defluviitaleaceae bacterium]|nr:methylated-DNA--[protein]-cysteine S-methyltransferase [Defluviitaleaceae bacterium]
MIRVAYDSPLGPLLVAADDDYILEISFAEADTRPEFHSTAKNNALDNAIIKACINELDAYFAGTLKEFTVPIKLTGTDFRMKVWAALMAIPYGQTINYKELAERIGQPTAVRAVGGANHHNPISIIVPCHRVIGADGTLTGYGGGLGNKEFLLNLERQSS